MHRNLAVLQQPNPFPGNLNRLAGCRKAHHGSDNSVRANDVLFALHALLLTSLTLGQVAHYENGNQRVSTTCQRVVAVAFAVIIVYSGACSLPSSVAL